MGSYYIPRNVKGETRLLYIFTIKSLITTAIGGAIGVFIYFLLSSFGFKTAGIIVAAIFALIGFGIGAIKMPSQGGPAFIKKVGGEELSDLIIRYIKFRKNKKIYLYTQTEDKKEEDKK